MTKKEHIEHRIDQIDEQIKKLSAQISTLESEKRELAEQLVYILKEATTKSLLDQIQEVNKCNSIHEYLFSDTKTTPIMDYFVSSNKKFLIFENVFGLDSTWNKVSLIIVKKYANVYYNDSGLTMTDLKKNVGKYICKNSLDFIKETDRLYPLYNELTKINQSNLQKGDIIAFQTPCLLGGQTFREQTGFGSEYCGDELVYQGREYGETTKFLIIGVIVS